MIVVLFGPVFLLVGPYLFTVLTSWRGWSNEPARFWRPFTLGSLVAAASCSVLSITHGQSLVGILVGGKHPNWVNSPEVDLLLLAATCFGSYVVFCLALLPHTVARLAYAIYRARKNA